MTGQNFDTDSEDSQSDTDSEISFTRHGPTESGPGGLLDNCFDPKIDVSDHDSDCDPSTTGYNDYDTEDEELNEEDEELNDGEERGVRIDKPVEDWCHCQNCKTMITELECYCCRESDYILNAIIADSDAACVTEVPIFITAIENKDMLELSAYGRCDRPLPKDEDGNIKSEGLRHTAYSTFLHICEIRNPGKSRRFVLPSCVVNRVRALYPSQDGAYKNFQRADFNSRM